VTTCSSIAASLSNLSSSNFQGQTDIIGWVCWVDDIANAYHVSNLLTPSSVDTSSDAFLPQENLTLIFCQGEILVAEIVD
jgi:hypothetical protein